MTARFNFKHPTSCDRMGTNRKENEIPCGIFNDRLIFGSHGCEP